MAFPCLPPSRGHWAGRMVLCPLRPRFLGMEGLVAGLGPALGLGLGLEPSPASGHGRPQGEAMRGWGGGGGGGGGRASACPTANGRRAEGSEGC